MIFYTKTYQLMNKNTVILESEITFTTVSTQKKPVVSGIQTTFLKPNLMPFGFITIEQWASQRLLSTQRMDVQRLFAILGVHDTFEYIEIFHAVSVNDTFWVRVKGTNDKWECVSPYTNEIDERIRYYAFTQTWDEKLSPGRVTPEYTTGGTFAKCWQRSNDKLYLCKYGSSGCKNTGLEPYSELYACQVAEALGIKHYTKYDLHTHNNRVYSKCKLFTNEKIGMISVDHLLSTANVKLSSYIDVYKWLLQQNIANLTEDFSAMMVLDSLIMNVDRHLGNISVMFDNDTLHFQRLAPVYDNNLALLPYWSDTDETLEAYMQKHSVNKDIVSKFGDDFVTLGKTFMTEQLHKRLLTMRNFEFKPVGRYNLSTSRLKALSALVRKQVNAILY